MFCEPFVKNVVSEILLRIVEQQPRVGTGHSNFVEFEKARPDQFRKLRGLIGRGRRKLAIFLDSLIVQRQSSAHYKICDLDTKVESVKVLDARHPRLRTTLFVQYMVIQNFGLIKRAFPDRFDMRREFAPMVFTRVLSDVL